MKKRLTSVLLTICMVASLFSAMGVTAFAEMKTTEYTLQSGDTVYKVCQKLGIDFYANYDWITNTNKIKNYSSLAVGRKIILPLGEVEDTTPPASTTPTTPPSTTVTTPAKANVNLLAGDTISAYLVPHVVSSGDTLYDICLGKGIDYNKNLDYIMKINGLKNANRIAVGRTLLLPVSSMPASGSCVAVVAHKVQSGDATYNICNSYNIDYNKNVDLMKALNGKDNMAVIKVGQTLLIPVPTSITPQTTVTTPSTGNNGGTNNDTTNKEEDKKEEDKKEEEQKPEATPAPVSYKITKNNTNVNHGSYSVLVNNNTNSDTAKKGDTVTVNVKAKTGYALDYVKVVDKNGKAVSLNETTFTMPESDVTIDVIFVSAKQYKITSEYSLNGSYIVTVNGVETTYASEGQTVVITPTPNYNYELKEITYRSSTGTVSNPVVDKSFVMPAKDVTVSVTFQSAAPHVIAKPASTNGSYEVKCNGTAVSEAKAGQVIDITTKANDGYEVKEIKVLPKDSGNTNTVAVNNGSFVMPEFDVKVQVSFKAQDFNIKSAAATNGSFTVVDGYDKTISSAETAAAIYVKPVPAAGYVIDKVSYTDYNGKVVEVGKTGEHYYFAMPASDITVNVTFKARVFYLSAHADSPAATFTVGGKEVTKAYMGETVTVNGNPAAGVKVKEIKAYNTSNREIPMTTANTLVMPAGNVCFKVSYELMDLALNKAATKNGSFSFKQNNASGDAIQTAHMGDTVYVATAPNDSYHTSKITVTDAKGVVTDITGSQTFTMPSAAVTVTVTFSK